MPRFHGYLFTVGWRRKPTNQEFVSKKRTLSYKRAQSDTLRTKGAELAELRKLQHATAVTVILGQLITSRYIVSHLTTLLIEIYAQKIKNRHRHRQYLFQFSAPKDARLTIFRSFRRSMHVYTSYIRFFKCRDFLDGCPSRGKTAPVKAYLDLIYYF